VAPGILFFDVATRLQWLQWHTNYINSSNINTGVCYPEPLVQVPPNTPTLPFLFLTFPCPFPGPFPDSATPLVWSPIMAHPWPEKNAFGSKMQRLNYVWTCGECMMFLMTLKWFHGIGPELYKLHPWIAETSSPNFSQKYLLQGFYGADAHEFINIYQISNKHCSSPTTSEELTFPSLNHHN